MMNNGPDFVKWFAIDPITLLHSAAEKVPKGSAVPIFRMVQILLHETQRTDSQRARSIAILGDNGGRQMFMCTDSLHTLMQF
jgi:hypothetical protein